MPVWGSPNVEAEQYTKARHAREAEERAAKARAEAEARVRAKENTIVMPRSNQERETTMSVRPYKETANQGADCFWTRADHQGISPVGLFERGLETGAIKPGDVVHVRVVRQRDGSVKSERSIARAGSQTR